MIFFSKTTTELWHLKREAGLRYVKSSTRQQHLAAVNFGQPCHCPAGTSSLCTNVEAYQSTTATWWHCGGRKITINAATAFFRLKGTLILPQRYCLQGKYHGHPLYHPSMKVPTCGSSNKTSYLTHVRHSYKGLSECATCNPHVEQHIGKTMVKWLETHTLKSIKMRKRH